MKVKATNSAFAPQREAICACAAGDPQPRAGQQQLLKYSLQLRLEEKAQRGDTGGSQLSRRADRLALR